MTSKKRVKKQRRSRSRGLGKRICMCGHNIKSHKDFSDKCQKEKCQCNLFEVP